MKPLFLPGSTVLFNQALLGTPFPKPALPKPVIRVTGCKQGDCLKHSDGVIFDREGILYAIWNCAICGENYCAPAGAMSVHINARDWRN